MPQSLRHFAAAVETLESSPFDDAAVAALERAIAAERWATPPEREAAQALVLRLAKVRLTVANPVTFISNDDSPMGGSG
jgi:hypothetical protein